VGVYDFSDFVPEALEALDSPKRQLSDERDLQPPSVVYTNTNVPQGLVNTDYAKFSLVLCFLLGYHYEKW